MRVTVSVPDDVGRQAEEAATAEGTSVSSVYARAVERYLEERRREEAAEELGALIDEMEVADDAVETLHQMRREDDRA